MVGTVGSGSCAAVCLAVLTLVKFSAVVCLFPRSVCVKLDMKNTKLKRKKGDINNIKLTVKLLEFSKMFHLYFLKYSDTSQDSNVCSACRGHAEVVSDGTFGEGVGLILLDDVHCAGSETSLLDCPHGIWGRTDCSHGEDVGVRCRARSGLETNEVPVIAPSTGER